MRGTLLLLLVAACSTHRVEPGVVSQTPFRCEVSARINDVLHVCQPLELVGQLVGRIDRERWTATSFPLSPDVDALIHDDDQAPEWELHHGLLLTKGTEGEPGFMSVTIVPGIVRGELGPASIAAVQVFTEYGTARTWDEMLARYDGAWVIENRGRQTHL